MASQPLPERVAFDARTRTPDGYGGTNSVWQEAFTAAAHFTYLRGGETVMQARLQGKQVVVVRVRNSEQARAVTPDARLRDVRRDVEYNVRSGPVPSEDRAWVDFTCESGVAT